MKISKGVEWAAHACAILAVLPEGWTLSRDALAEYLGVPAPYLAKQLQALSRAGLVSAQRGVSGGYRLSRPADAITLWDMTAAVEGQTPLFRCTEVRQNGPCPASKAECTAPCEIASAFGQAESAYRDALGAVRLDTLVEQGRQTTPAGRKQQISAWIDQNAARPA